MTIHLGRSLPNASRDRPGWQRGNPPDRAGGLPRRPIRHPYLVLLPVGFTVPAPLPAPRCALTAPFHPCRPRARRRARGFGGLLSVALSLRSPSPGVTRHRVSVEPGLSSPRQGVSPGEKRSSGRLARPYKILGREIVKSKEAAQPFWRAARCAAPSRHRARRRNPPAANGAGRR